MSSRHVDLNVELERVEYLSTHGDDAEQMAGLVKEFVKVRAVAQPREGLVIVRGTAEQVGAASELIKTSTAGIYEGPDFLRHTFLKRLRRARATEVARALQELIDHDAFRAVPKKADEGPTLVTADDEANILFVKVDVGYEEAVRRVIDDLDREVGVAPAVAERREQVTPRDQRAVLEEKREQDLRLAQAHRIPLRPDGEMIGVISVYNADLGDVVRIASDLFAVTGGFESTHGHVIVRGKPEEVERALALISRLDRVRQVFQSPEVFTMALWTAKAANVAAVMNEVIGRGILSSGLKGVVVADDRTNSVVVSVNVAASERLRNMILELDSTPNGEGTATEIRIEGRELAPTTRP